MKALGATAIIVAALAWLARLTISENLKKLMAIDFERSTAAIGDE